MTETSDFAPPAVGALTWVRDAAWANAKERGDRLEAYFIHVLIPRRFPGATNVKLLGDKIDTSGGQERFDVSFDLGDDTYVFQAKNTAPVHEGTVYKYSKAFDLRKAERGWTKWGFVTTSGFTSRAQTAMTAEGIIGFDFAAMEPYDVPLAEFILAWEKAVKVSAKPKKVPFPWNAEAIVALVALGYSRPRNIIPRATGTGKTIVQAGVIAGLGARRVLALVPNIALTEQLAESYVEDLTEHGYEVMVVASKPALIPGVETVTDPALVAEFLLKPGKRILISTYQSVRDVIVEALDIVLAEDPTFEFDYGIFDEAHRTATSNEEGSTFNDALYNDKVPIRRRDFFTATPRVVKATGGTIRSMDNVSLYGRIVDAAALPLAEAIKLGAISPFRLLAGFVTTKDWSIPKGWNPDGFTHEDIAKASSTLTQMRYNGSYLSCHTTGSEAGGIEKAERAVKLYHYVALRMEPPLNVDARTANGESPKSVQRAARDHLIHKREGWIHIVCHANLFTEGVDIKASVPKGVDSTLTGVVFFDARQSATAIIQTIGRALRFHPGKTADVIVPMFVPHGMSAEEYVHETKYGLLYQVVQALEVEDAILSDLITTRTVTGPVVVSSKVDFPVIVTLPTDWPDEAKAMAAVKSGMIDTSLSLAGEAAVAKWRDEHDLPMIDADLKVLLPTPDPKTRVFDAHGNPVFIDGWTSEVQRTVDGRIAAQPFPVGLR